MPSEQGVHECRDLLLQGGINEISGFVERGGEGVGKDFRFVHWAEVQINADLPQAPMMATGFPLKGAQSGSRDTQSRAFFRAGARE